MSAVAYDVAAVRARFSALANQLVFFDGPGGTQVPDEVIDAIADYLRESNANVSGPYETSRRTERLVADSRLPAARLFRCSAHQGTLRAEKKTPNIPLPPPGARGWEGRGE